MMKTIGMRCFAICVMLTLLMTSIRVNASENQQPAAEIYVDRYTVNDEQIKIYVNQNQQDPSWITSANITLMFGSKELETPQIQKFSDSPVKTTYKCLIDVSGSMSQDRIDTAKEIIKRLAANKRAEDNITITAMGNDIIRSDYMTDALEISEKVSSISVTHEDTNLYYAIVEEIKELKTNDQVGEKRCLIIFSDGADDQATGITREEATKAVTDSHIPIFTVAMPKNKSNKNDQEMAKVLGSFARISSGGDHYYTPDFEGSDLSLLADRILGKVNNSLILTEDIRELDTNEKAHELKVSVKTAEGNTEDVIDVAESDVKKIKEIQEELEPEPEPEPEPDPEPEPEVVEEPEEEPIVEEVVEVPQKKLIMGLDPLIFYIALGIFVLLLIALVVFIILSSRKKASGEASEENESPVGDLGNTIGGVEDLGVTGEVVDFNGVTMPLENASGSPTVGMEAPVNKKVYKVVLTRMGKEIGDKNIFKFDLTDKYTIGRSSTKSKLSFSNDAALSGLHCTMFVKNKKIYIKDEGTTNGTFVNGVPITGEYALENGDTIIIGSYEYRVTW